MILVTLKHHFSAGHRLPGLAGEGAKCANLHGHTFTVEWMFRTDSVEVDTIEFSSAKAILRGWVDEHLDHGYILGEQDSMLGILKELGTKLYVMPHFPTTEAIAQEIAIRTRPLLGMAWLTGVKVSEGPNNTATWISGTALQS